MAALGAGYKTRIRDSLMGIFKQRVKSFLAVNIPNTLIGWTLADFVLAKLLPHVDEAANESAPEPAPED